MASQPSSCLDGRGGPSIKGGGCPGPWPLTRWLKHAESGGQPVIPPKRNRTFKRPYDAELYKERNIIERFFNKLKQFRRVATRYDKLLDNFMGFVKLAAIAIWLK